VLVVCLVEEDVFAVVAVRREVFEDAVRVDAVLATKLLPELEADCSHRCYSGCRTGRPVW